MTGERSVVSFVLRSVVSFDFLIHWMVNRSCISMLSHRDPLGCFVICVSAQMVFYTYGDIGPDIHRTISIVTRCFRFDISFVR